MHLVCTFWINNKLLQLHSTTWIFAEVTSLGGKKKKKTTNRKHINIFLAAYMFILLTFFFSFPLAPTRISHYLSVSPLANSVSCRTCSPPASLSLPQGQKKKTCDLGPKFEPNIFLKLFGRRRDIPAKSRDIPPKKFDFPGFEGHTELFGPHPFMWKTPTPLENIRTQKFGFVFFFLCLKVPSNPKRKGSMEPQGKVFRTTDRVLSNLSHRPPPGICVK